MHVPHASPVLLLLTGPAASGKTAAAEYWASMQATPTAHLSVDDVFRFVKAGRVNPKDAWTPDHPIQTNLARDACAELGRRYLQIGYNCIIDDAIFPASPGNGYAEWRSALGDTPHQLIVLMPSLEMLQKRDNDPTRKWPQGSESIYLIHSGMLPWTQQQQFPVIDNTNLTIEQTAYAIQQHVLSTAY